MTTENAASTDTSAAVAAQSAHVAPGKGTSKKGASTKKGAPKSQKSAKGGKPKAAAAKPKKVALAKKAAKKAATPKAARGHYEWIGCGGLQCTERAFSAVPPGTHSFRLMTHGCGSRCLEDKGRASEIQRD